MKLDITQSRGLCWTRNQIVGPAVCDHINNAMSVIRGKALHSVSWTVNALAVTTLLYTESGRTVGCDHIIVH